MRIAIIILAAFVAITPADAALSPRAASRLIDDLTSDDDDRRARARARLIAARDLSIAPALMEVVFFSREGRGDAVDILESLLEVRHGRDYEAWVAEIGRRSDIVPKEGYLRFKASQFARIDPAFGEFLDPRHRRTIRPEEIVFGGVAKDGIPALDRPSTVPAAEARWLSDAETVFGVSVGDAHRAYPQRIVDWHEMVNDVIAGTAITFSYCTLCGSGIVFDPVGSDGRTYTFGSSGLLYRSNKLMYDRQTNTLWSNLTGEPVMGPLVGKGLKLEILPVTVTTWGEWRRQHPDTDVLSLETGHQRDYRPGAAYGRYFASPEPMFPVPHDPPPALRPKEWLWVVDLDGRKKAYPLRHFENVALLHDSLGEVPLVLLSDPSGDSLRVYRSEGRTLSWQERRLVDANGTRYVVTEDALAGDDGSRLPRVPGHRIYWFGWHAFFPDGEVYEPRAD